MFCFECIYWSEEKERCTLNCAECRADRLPEKEYDPENPDHERDIKEED